MSKERKKIPVTNLTEDKSLIEKMNKCLNSRKENITESPNKCESGHASAYTEINDDEISAQFDKCLKNNMMMGGRDKIRRAIQKYIDEKQQPDEYSPLFQSYYRENIDRYLYAIREVFPDTMEFIGALHYIGESLKADGLICEYTVNTIFSDYVSLTFTGSDFTFKDVIGKTIDYLHIKDANSEKEKRKTLENTKKAIIKNWSYYKMADSDEMRAITKVIKSYLNSVMDLFMNKDELSIFEGEMCAELKELGYIRGFVLKTTLENVSLQVELCDGYLLFFDIPFPHESPVAKDNTVSHENVCNDEQAGATNPESAINPERIGCLTTAKAECISALSEKLSKYNELESTDCVIEEELNMEMAAIITRLQKDYDDPEQFFDMISEIAEKLKSSALIDAYLLTPFIMPTNEIIFFDYLTRNGTTHSFSVLRKNVCMKEAHLIATYRNLIIDTVRVIRENADRTDIRDENEKTVGQLLDWMLLWNNNIENPVCLLNNIGETLKFHGRIKSYDVTVITDKAETKKDWYSLRVWFPDGFCIAFLCKSPMKVNTSSEHPRIEENENNVDNNQMIFLNQLQPLILHHRNILNNKVLEDIDIEQPAHTIF